MDEGRKTGTLRVSLGQLAVDFDREKFDPLCNKRHSAHHFARPDYKKTTSRCLEEPLGGESEGAGRWSNLPQAQGFSGAFVE
jgi:hypothetical protein